MWPLRMSLFELHINEHATLYIYTFWSAWCYSPLLLLFFSRSFSDGAPPNMLSERKHVYGFSICDCKSFSEQWQLKYNNRPSKQSLFTWCRCYGGVGTIHINTYALLKHENNAISSLSPTTEYYSSEIVITCWTLPVWRRKWWSRTG